jgi:hypothetical protein
MALRFTISVQSILMTAPADQHASLLVVVPIYKPELNDLERLSLTYSLSKLSSRQVEFFGPAGLPMGYYTRHFPQVGFRAFDEGFFKSIKTYSQLLLRADFYQNYQPFDFILLLQPDALVLRDDVSYWTSQPFDYLGAPWLTPWKLRVNVARFAGANERHIEVQVGNGGLSLRRISAVLDLFDSFGDVAKVAYDKGLAEDMFFGIAGVLAENFRVPDCATASRFSMEFYPRDLIAINGGVTPMAGHDCWNQDAAFWLARIEEPFRSDFESQLALADIKPSTQTHSGRAES